MALTIPERLNALLTELQRLTTLKQNNDIGCKKLTSLLNDRSISMGRNLPIESQKSLLQPSAPQQNMDSIQPE